MNNHLDGWCVVQWRETGRYVPMTNPETGETFEGAETDFVGIVSVHAAEHRSDAVANSLELNCEMSFKSKVSYSVMPEARAMQLNEELAAKKRQADAGKQALAEAEREGTTE